MHVFNANDATLYFNLRISVREVLSYKKTSKKISVHHAPAVGLDPPLHPVVVPVEVLTAAHPVREVQVPVAHPPVGAGREEVERPPKDSNLSK